MLENSDILTPGKLLELLGGSYKDILMIRDKLIFFPWNVNLGNYSSWSVIRRFCVPREELELLTDIRDFTSAFYVIMRRESSGPNGYHLSSLELAFQNLSSYPLSSARTGYWMSIFLAYFCDSGNWNSDIREPWFSIFSVRELCQTHPPPLYDPLRNTA